MTNAQVTSTGIAVALAVVVALGMLFAGPNVFALFFPQDTQAPVATTTMQTGPLPEGELPTELTGIDTEVGTGETAVAGSQVTVNYVGMLPDGTIFDASERHGKPFTFTLGAGSVIQGWDIGVAGMKEGGTRRLIVPPAYGYGAQEIPGVIPANSTLIFDVELIAVE
jgi:FKBP-type peptidyl-prolyl cis-trans isomerase